jgi:hypothetical protein
MIKFLVGFMVSFSVLALDDFDLYKYGPDATVEIERVGVVLKVVLYKEPEELNKAWNKSTGENGNENSSVRAFTQTREGDDVCAVHFIPPTIWDDRETLAIMGHEILHCLGANHQNAAEEIAKKKKERENKYGANEESDEDLLAEDRRLELEWLREDYKQLGIIIDSDYEITDANN